MQSIDSVLPYKLEKHLEDICNNNDTYVNLLSVWNINKKMCQDALSTIVMNYPHYTKHDSSHCEAIITNIEMLLGEDAIRVLSPTDTWLLLHTAYLHDIGMVIECKRIEENWGSKEFQDYLSETEKSSDDEFTKEEIDFKDLMKEWEKVAVIWNLSDYISHTGVSEIVNDELILQLLNKKADTIPFSMVIIDKNFAEMLEKESQNSIKIIPDEKNRIYLESFTTEKHVLPEVVDSATKEYLLGCLVRKEDSEASYTIHGGAIRRFMIGIGGYEKISTTVVPFGVDGDGFRGKGYIISPVTIEQWGQNRHLNRDAFIDQICSGTAFANLVDHVYEHSFCEPEKEEIENEYKRFTGELYDIAQSTPIEADAH